MTKKDKARELFAFMAALLVPVLLLVPWHIMNHAGPRGDDAWYLKTSYEIFNSLRTGGLWTALGDLYMVRYKPLFHPVLGAVALAFGLKGPALLVALYGLLCYLGSSIYAYLFLRRNTGRLGAALAVATLMSFPWLIENFYRFGAEPLQLFFVFAGLYHFLASEGLVRTQHATLGGLWAGLSLCQRPVESLLFWGLLAIPYLYYLQKEKKLGFRNGLALAGLACLCLVCVFYPIYSGVDYGLAARYFLALACLILAGLLLSYAKTLGLRRNVLLAALAIMIVPLLWLLPSIRTLYFWALSCSFGADAVSSGGRASADYFGFLRETGFFLIGRQTLFCLPAVAFFFWQASRQRALALSLKRGLSFFLAAVFPLLFGALTQNSDPRYYYAGAAFMLLLLLVASLNRELRFYGARVLLLVPVLLLNLSFVVTESYGAKESQSPLLVRLFDLRWPKYAPWPPEIRRRDETEALFYWVNTQIEKNMPLVKKPRLVVLMDYRETDNVWLFNDFMFALLEQEHHYLVVVNEPMTELSAFASTEEALRSILSKTDYVLIGPAGSDFPRLTAHVRALDESHLLQKLASERFLDRTHRQGVYALYRVLVERGGVR